MTSEAEICRTFCEDRISTLPDDMLIQILCLIPTEDAVTTMILSKRWRFVWTMIPKLDYSDKSYRGKKSVWDFIDKSLQLHKAPSLEKLCIQLDRQCPVEIDVGKCVLNAVERCVRELFLLINIEGSSTIDPTSLPKSLYTCKTLVKLTLISCKILVDVPSRACLPSLQGLFLLKVVYKDQDTHVRLLSSCPVLQKLVVLREEGDNVTTFIVKVPSLQHLMYFNKPSRRNLGYDAGGFHRSLFIDSPGLNNFDIYDRLGEGFSIQNDHMPRLDTATLFLGYSGWHPTNKFLRSLSLVRGLKLVKVEVARFSTISFSQLIEFKLLYPVYSKDWLEALISLLHNAPKLKVLKIESSCNDLYKDLPLSWNQPSSVPGCLSSHLEIFEWIKFGGRREETQFVSYILENSKCLKRVGVIPRSSYNDEEKMKMMKDLESIYRVSASSQLLFTARLRQISSNQTIILC